MRANSSSISYYTWYDFKKELQRRSGIVVLNSSWFEIKPRSPLPWYQQQMEEALSYLSNRTVKLRKCPRCSGNLVLDRDIDGFYKRCIQCSYRIELPQSKPELARSKKIFNNKWANLKTWVVKAN
jgi:hypothetical protein